MGVCGKCWTVHEIGKNNEMRILDQAIEEKLYIGSDITLAASSWEDFEDATKKYPVYLFGSGEGAEFVLQKYGDELKITGVLDNDSEKWGKGLQEYITLSIGDDIKISAPDILKEVAREKVVILITSVRYCDEIFTQLKRMNVDNIYSLLHMEANERNKEGQIAESNVENEQVKYAKECINRPVCDNKILLARDGLAGHGKQIFKRLVELRPDLDLVWVTERNDAEIMPGVRKIVQSDWQRYIEELETAKIWIFGDMIPEYSIKRDEQVYIHVKHWASITLKSFYFHLKKHLDTKSIYEYYRHNTDAMDYCMVGSDFDERTCRSGFDFDGEFIRVGSPRSDVLFQDGIKEAVYKKIGIKNDVHTVIYAPTFRAKNKDSLIGHMRDVDLDFDRIKEAFENKFGGEWIVLLRIHPDVAMESKKIQKKSFVYDVSQYPDSEELVAACDVMISDYSSIMFEPSFVGKPVFLYAPDVEEYISNDRELLIDYYELPFPISKDNDELVSVINAFELNSYNEKVTSFLNKYGIQEDGHAADRAAEFILSIL